ncbi:MAG: hypothetical protein U1C96_02965 [Gallionella sp.]|nr:hypothetical protein [Gallionella sp.]
MFGKRMLWGILCAVLASCGGEQQQDKESPPKTPDSGKNFEQIEKEFNCLACHLPFNQMGAPTWQDVVLRYENKNAEQYLMQKIISGGGGVWGTMDMPPYQELSEDEARLLVKGIMLTEVKQKR